MKIKTDPMKVRVS